MPHPTQAQWQAIIDCENTLDYYLPETPGVPGVDADARALLRLASSRYIGDSERDALIRFVTEWVTRKAREIEVDRTWEDMCANGEVPA